MPKGYVFIALVSVFFISCASDPAKLKVRYFRSGSEYYRAQKYREAVIEFRNAIQIDPKFAAAHRELGRSYLAAQNGDGAIREFNSALTLDPGDREARLNLMSAEVDRGMYAEARSAAKQILTSDSGNERARAILGRAELAMRNMPGAIHEFEKLVDEDPGRVVNYAALGSVYMAAGHREEAEAAYRKGVAINPKSVDARLSLGVFYFSERKFAAAESEMRVAMGLNASAVMPRLFLARTLVAENRLADAETVCLRLKTMAPDDPRAYRALAAFYAGAGQHRKAIEELSSVAAAKPADVVVKGMLAETLIDAARLSEAEPLVRTEIDRARKDRRQPDTRILVSYARLLIREGKYADAVAQLRESIANASGSANAFYYLGIAQRMSGEPVQSRMSLTRALALSPNMSRAAAALADLDRRDGDGDDALKHADTAIAQDPGFAEGYVARGRALIARGDVTGAAAAFENALRCDPLNLAALAGILNAAISQTKTEEAVDRIERLTQRYPTNPGLQVLLGLGEFELGHFPRAESCANRAMALNPKTPAVWALKARVDLAGGRKEEGKNDLRAAIAASPGTLSNYTALAVEYEKENNWPEATKLFEKAHAVDRNSASIMAELAFLYLEHGGDVNVALGLAQAARQQMPDSAMTSDALGWAHYKLGSADLAIEELEQSVRMTPANPVYQYHLGMAYAGTKKWDKAARSLRVALSEGTNFPYARAAKAELDQIEQRSR